MRSFDAIRERRVVGHGSERSQLGELLGDVAGRQRRQVPLASSLTSGEWRRHRRSSAMTGARSTRTRTTQSLSHEGVDCAQERQARATCCYRRCATRRSYVGARVLVGRAPTDDCFSATSSMRSSSTTLLPSRGSHTRSRCQRRGIRMSAIATGTLTRCANISQEGQRPCSPACRRSRSSGGSCRRSRSGCPAIDALRASIERAQRRSPTLRRAILERAFRGELVPQDPSDEPAETLLARIRGTVEGKSS